MHILYFWYRVGQGFVSRNASRNVCGRVYITIQGEVQLVTLDYLLDRGIVIAQR